MIEADERVGARGEIIVPLDEGAMERALQGACDDGYRSVAIVSMHGYRFPDHERRIGQIEPEGSKVPWHRLSLPCRRPQRLGIRV